VGFTNGWDNADNNNGYPRPIGSFAFTPNDKLSATVNYLFGPEQNRDQMRGKDINNRWIVDTTILYTGIDRVTWRSTSTSRARRTTRRSLPSDARTPTRAGVGLPAT